MHITVIAKAPVAGRVKTRLCPPCSPQDAADVAEAALVATLAGIEAVAPGGMHPLAGAVHRVVLLDGHPGAWLPGGFDVVDQRGDGLAARLSNGFDDLGIGVIVGMDTPAAVAALGQAFVSLIDGIDVLGLASDGGYWCIGLHAVDASVFNGVPMSASHTGLAQLRRLHELRRPVRLLHAGRDLDTIDDLRAHAAGASDDLLARTARRVLAHH